MLELDGDDQTIAVRAHGRIGELASPTAVAHLVLPAHPFDPSAWAALGRSVLGDASVRVTDVVLDPDALARLGLSTELRGRLDASIEVGPGATTGSITADVRGLHGGRLVRELDVHATGGFDRTGIRGDAVVHVGSTRLVELAATSPLAVERWQELRGASFAATASVSDVPVREALSVLGRDDVAAGTASANIEVGGTFDRPTVHGRITTRGVAARSSGSGRPAPVLDELVAVAALEDNTGKLELTGREASGGTLRATASGRPSQPSTLVAKLDAGRFDLAPIAAFLPGPLGAARGVLDGSVALRGEDEATGALRIHDARIPLASAIGTLRRAELEVTAKAGHRLAVSVDGRLGAGDVRGNATLTLDGVLPDKVEASLTVRHVSPIGAIEPVVDANASAHLERHGRRWTGTAQIRDGNVAIPMPGTPLLPAGTPGDISFVGETPHVAMSHRGPSDPWLVLDVHLGTTTVVASSLEVVDDARATVSGQVRVSVGDGYALEGQLDTEDGDIALMGHRYTIDRGTLVFDGSLDPLLDIKMIHEFPQVTLIAQLSGRLSSPQPKLSSEPATYTQGQLLGFFAGGEPGGDPGSQAREAATGATVSLLSSELRKRLNEHLPIKLDVVQYEAATGSTSASTLAGKWVDFLGRKLFIGGRHHLEARPDENSNEAEGEWYLFPNFLIQGDVGDRGYHSGDLLWRKRW
jgi:hypothetical protein